MSIFSSMKYYFGSSTNYFTQAKSNQEAAVKAASITVTKAYETTQDSVYVIAQLAAGFVGYDYMAGKIMSAYAANALAANIGVSTPTIVNKIVNGAASFIFKYPATALASTIGAVFFAYPDKLIKTVKDGSAMVSSGAETIIDVTKCAANLTLGTLIATAEAADYVTDHLFGHSNSEINDIKMSGEYASFDIIDVI